MAPRPPLRRVRRLLPPLLLTAQAACPGFGDRLPPDAALAGLDAAGGAPEDLGPTNGDARPPDTGASDAGSTVDAVATEPPRFDPEIADFMRRHCSLCHGETPVGGAPYALVTWEENVEHAAAVVDRVVTRRDMPPGGGLVTDAERERLVAWVAAGTPP